METKINTEQDNMSRNNFDRVGEHQSTGANKKNVSKVLKVVAAIIVVAGLGVGAYFAFFTESKKHKLAAAEKEDYLEAIDNFESIIDDAISPSEFKDAEKCLKLIEEMDDDFSKVMPEVYNNAEDCREKLENRRKDALSTLERWAEDDFNDKNYHDSYQWYDYAHWLNPQNSDYTDGMKKTAAYLGYIYVSDVDFSNSHEDGTDIDEAGETLYAEKMRYLWPRITYTSLLNEDEGSKVMKYYIKIITPNGKLESGTPAGYTYMSEVTLEPGEEDLKIWLKGWGNDNMSTFVQGQYTFEMWYDGNKIFTGYVTLE